MGGREEVLASQLDFLGAAAAVVVALASVLATACQPASLHGHGSHLAGKENFADELLTHVLNA